MAKMKEILVKSWHTISCSWADNAYFFLMLIQLKWKAKNYRSYLLFRRELEDVYNNNFPVREICCPKRESGKNT